MADFAEHELLSLHELLMGTALHAKELQAHLGGVQDPELRQIAQKCLEGKRVFVQEVASIIR